MYKEEYPDFDEVFYEKMRFVRKIPHCRLRAYHDTTLWIHLNSCQCQLNGLNPALSIMQDANADMDEDTAGASPRSPPDADGAASDMKTVRSLAALT